MRRAGAYGRQFRIGANGLDYSIVTFLNYAPDAPDVSTRQCSSVNLHFALLKLDPFVPVAFVKGQGKE